MRRAAGTSLVEVMGALAAASIVIAGATSIMLQTERDRRFAGALADDALALRRAAGAIERDVRCADRVQIDGTRVDLGDAAWRLDGATLTRNDTPVARRVAAFDVAQEPGGAIRVRLELDPRTTDAARHAAVAIVATPRAEGAR